jgi:phosphoribosylformylglycinamidine synthase
LNFGNPYKPEIFWQFREAVEGIAEACRSFGTPVTGGNVSLYNESPAGAVDPTPTVAMVGLIDDERHITTQWFKMAGDAIILVGPVAGVGPLRRSSAKADDPGPTARDILGGSRYLKVCHGQKEGPAPVLDLDHEIKIQNAVRDLIREGLVKSAHDCSEGGIAVALAECCFNPNGLLGANVNLALPLGWRSNGNDRLATCATLFNEAQSRILISVAAENLEQTISKLHEAGVPHSHLGRVSGNELRIRIDNDTFRWPVSDLYDDWWNAIRRAVEGDSIGQIPSL